MVNSFKQEGYAPAIVALPFDLADPSLERSFLNLDVVATLQLRRLEPHTSIRFAARANAGDNFFIDLNRDPAGAHYPEHASSVAHCFQCFARSEPGEEISGEKRFDHCPPAAPDKPFLAKLRQENFKDKRADGVRRERLSTMFRMDNKPVALLPTIHLKGRRASSPLRTHTCAREKREQNAGQFFD